jgi:hypothetical protein
MSNYLQRSYLSKLVTYTLREHCSPFQTCFSDRKYDPIGIIANDRVKIINFVKVLHRSMSGLRYTGGH